MAGLDLPPAPAGYPGEEFFGLDDPTAASELHALAEQIDYAQLDLEYPSRSSSTSS